MCVCARLRRRKGAAQFKCAVFIRMRLGDSAWHGPGFGSEAGVEPPARYLDVWMTSIRSGACSSCSLWTPESLCLAVDQTLALTLRRSTAEGTNRHCLSPPLANSCVLLTLLHRCTSTTPCSQQVPQLGTHHSLPRPAWLLCALANTGIAVHPAGHLLWKYLSTF